MATAGDVTDTSSTDTPDTPDTRADRGRTTVALVVVRRIAEYAADHTDATTTTPRRGITGGSDAGVSARVSGSADQADVRLDVPLTYPTPIGPAVDAVRGAVRERVHTLTGYTVRSLDVTVTALTTPAPTGAPAPGPTARVV